LSETGLQEPPPSAGFQPTQPSPFWVMWAFLGAIVGAALVLFLSKGTILSDNISYIDLAAVLLVAVTVLLTVFGLIIAIAAIYGYHAFMKTSVAAATAAAKVEANSAAVKHVTEYISSNLPETLFIDQAKAAAATVLTRERLDELISRRVDALLSGNDRDDQLDAEEPELNAAGEPEGDGGDDAA
jgi:asparagine N-glycosylation enzyme membrane subunit Stt3